MAEQAAHLVDAVLPWVPVRQWVLTVPHRLRYRLAFDHALCRAVLGVFIRAVLGWYRRRARRAGIADDRSGTVTVVQRFGSGLELNVHFHVLGLDGVFAPGADRTLRFHRLPPPTDEDVARLVCAVARRIGRLLTRRGLSGDAEVTDPLATESPALAGLASAAVQGRLALGPRAGARAAPSAARPHRSRPRAGALSRLLLSRCTCFDGNAADGDGCDATCQVEPCFTCTDDPSVCAPSGDGAACDDRHDCTTGETCTAGSCGGGAAVPGCVDLAGGWHLHGEIETLTTFDRDASFTQRNGVLRVVDTGPTPGLAEVGTIDPSTGSFELAAPLASLLAFVNCGGFVFKEFSGTASAAGFVGIGMAIAATPTACVSFGLRVTGTRLNCGNSVVDPGETCNDGNADAGDGCDAACRVERCYACSGTPSVCVPTPGAACDDGSLCTTGDTCGAGAACTGMPVPDGTSCDPDGDVCTGVATCLGGACQPGSPPACGACERCDPAAGCVTGPRLACVAPTNGKRTTLTIRNTSEDRHDAIDFKWTTGPDAPAGISFGSPQTTDDIGLCVFDASTPAPALVFRALAPAGGSCAGRPCWRASSTGATYRDRDGTPDGLTVLQLKGGADRGKAHAQGKGALLSSRPFGLPALPLGLPLLVQFQNVRGQCIEARFDAGGVTRNDPVKSLFKASATP